MNDRTPGDPRDRRPAPQPLTRRGWMGIAGGSVAAVSASLATGRALAREQAAAARTGVVNGRIKQSVARWCFQSIPIEQLAREASAMGIKSIELADPAEWAVLKKHGLICAISMAHGFERGLNHVENHPECIEKLTATIEATADAGFPSVITFSGMRGQLTDEEGIRNTVTGLKQVMPLAEKRGVNICLEPLNTRVAETMKGHPGYQCDRVEWAAEVCDKIGSPRMKILFDIYHTQIMQGDLLVRIKQYRDYIAHYHTAGVPGRRELDGVQEINYPAVMQAIVDSGYEGYVGQEFIPTTPDPIAALREAVCACDV